MSNQDNHSPRIKNITIDDHKFLPQKNTVIKPQRMRKTVGLLKSPQSPKEPADFFIGFQKADDRP